MKDRIKEILKKIILIFYGKIVFIPIGKSWKKWILGSGGTLRYFHYEIENQKLIWNNLRKGDIFYDIGANVGFFTILGAQKVGKYGKVYSFEPSPKNIPILLKHISINKIENVVVLPYALSDENSYSYLDDSSPRGAHLSEKGEEVETKKIDTLVETKKIMPPNFMKIDVEGAEIKVIKGGIETISKYKPKILISTHSENLKKECINILDELGFKTKLYGSEIFAQSNE